MFLLFFIITMLIIGVLGFLLACQLIAGSGDKGYEFIDKLLTALGGRDDEEF